MMIVIHGINPDVKFYQLKGLVRDICPTDDLLFDRFLPDVNKKKKVKVGCATNEQAIAILKKLNGYNLHGSILEVRPIGSLPYNEVQGPDPGPYFQGCNYGEPFQGPNDGPPLQGGNNGLQFQRPYDEPPFQGPDDRPPFQGPNDRPPFQGPNDRPPFQGPNDRTPFQGRTDGPLFQGRNEGPSFQGRNDGPLFQGPNDRPSFQGRTDGPPFQGSTDAPPFQGRYDGPPFQGRNDGPPFQRPNERPSFEVPNDGPPFQVPDNRSSILSQAMPALGHALLKSFDVRTLDDVAHVQHQLKLFNEWQANQPKDLDTPPLGTLEPGNDRFIDDRNSRRPDSPTFTKSRPEDRSGPPRPSDERRDLPSFDRHRNELDYRGSKDMNRFSPGPRNVERNGSPKHGIDSHEAYKEGRPRVDDWTIGSKKGFDMGRSMFPPAEPMISERMSPQGDSKFDSYRKEPYGPRSGGRINSPPRDIVDRPMECYRARSPLRIDEDLIRGRGPGGKRVFPSGEPMGRMGSPRDEFVPQRGNKLGMESRRKEFGRHDWSPHRREVDDRRRSPIMKDKVTREFDRYSSNPIFSDRDPVTSPPQVESFKNQAVKDVGRNNEKPYWEHRNYSDRGDEFDLQRGGKRLLRTPPRSRSRSPMWRPSSRDREHTSAVWTQNIAHNSVGAPSSATWTGHHNDDHDWGTRVNDKNAYTKSDIDVKGKRSVASKFDMGKKGTRWEHSGDFHKRLEEHKDDFIRRSDLHDRNIGNKRAPKPQKDQDDMMARKNACGQISKSIMDRHKIKPHHEHYQFIFSGIKDGILELINEKFKERTTPKIIMHEFPIKVNVKQEDRLLEDVMAELNSILEADVGVDSSEQSSGNIKPSIAQLHGLQQFTVTNPILETNSPMQVGLPLNTASSVQIVPQVNFLNSIMPTCVPNLEISSNHQEDNKEDLSLCKINFNAFTKSEVTDIREFVINQIFDASLIDVSNWSPTITIKGLKTGCRYQLKAEDDKSYKWLRKLDFTKFTKFDVLLYTKEEMWYERGYILLKSLSGYSQIDPLRKLKLQNTFLEGVDVGKWKLVKMVTSENGIRIYVDIPPSCKKALEKYNMMLSYELEKVYLVMKTSVVDTTKFDLDLLSDRADLPLKQCEAKSNLPIINEKGVVRLSLEDSVCSVTQAKRIRDKVLQILFEYLCSSNNVTRTDFLKCGYASPGHLAILPENKESGDWFNDRFIGVIAGRKVVVVENENVANTYLKVSALIPAVITNRSVNPATILKIIADLRPDLTLNIDKWKIINNSYSHNGLFKIELCIDPESVYTLHKHSFSLGLRIGSERKLVTFEHKCPDIKEYLNNCNYDTMDSYIVTNMDLDSD